MNKTKLSLLFILTGIVIAGYTFFNLSAHSINFGDTYYVAPADSMALVILVYYFIVAIIYYLFRNCINYSVGIISLFSVTLPILYMCWFNGFGEAVSLYDSTIWTSEYVTNGLIILFLTGNSLFIINSITALSRLIKVNRSATI